MLKSFGVLQWSYINVIKIEKVAFIAIGNTWMPGAMQAECRLKIYLSPNDKGNAY